MPSVVAIEGQLVTVDGAPTDRAIARSEQTRIQYARRGGKRRRPRS